MYLDIKIVSRQDIESLLVPTYVVCERLSVMQRLPESGKADFVLKLDRTPCSEIRSRTPHPPQKNFQTPIFSLSPNLTFRRTPPPKMSKLQFFSLSPNLTFPRTPPAPPPIFQTPIFPLSPNPTFPRTPSSPGSVVVGVCGD